MFIFLSFRFHRFNVLCRILDSTYQIRIRVDKQGRQKPRPCRASPRSQPRTGLYPCRWTSLCQGLFLNCAGTGVGRHGRRCNAYAFIYSNRYNWHYGRMGEPTQIRELGRSFGSSPSSLLQLQSVCANHLLSGRTRQFKSRCDIAQFLYRIVDYYYTH